MLVDGHIAIHDLIASIPWWSTTKRLLATIAIAAVVLVLVWALRFAFDRLRKRFPSGTPFMYVVQKLGAYAIVFIGFVAGVRALGIDLGSLTLFAGAVGVGLGLGLQGVVKEFVSGLVLIFDPNIQLGDFVEIEDGVRGEVVEIGPRATRIRSNDDLHIVIPNSTLMQSRVSNWTFNEGSRRFHVPFSVAEESDVTLVHSTVLAAAKALPFTLPDDHLHKTQVWLIAFGGSGLDFDLVVWPTPESSRHPRTLHAAYTWAIYQALLKAGIANANDQMDLNLHGLFGREGEEALRTLRLDRRGVSHPLHEEDPATGNDAAIAMVVDADRQRVQRETEQQQRRRVPPPEAAKEE
jgi:small-conductance mechanosensitive channel